MNKNPTVSVIIPTYNRAHLVGRAIQSVLNQTYQDFELIVVDDGSTDNTDEVIKEFQQKDNRIIYLKHDRNKGGSAARNTGIKASKGEYIAFQDSDDEWLSDKLKKQVIVFFNLSPEVGIIYTDMWRINKRKRKIYFYSPHIMPEDKIVYKQALDYGVANIGIGTSLIRKEVFEKVGFFDENFPRFIDLEFFIRLSKYYYFYHIAEPLVYWFDEGERISSNINYIVIAQKLILEKYIEDIKQDNRLLANHYLKIGSSMCLNGEIKEGEEYILKAINIYQNNSKEREILSKNFINIGISLCMNKNFLRGRKYIIKAAKIGPFRLKYLIIAFISFFGEIIFLKVIKLYRILRGNI